MKMGPGKYDDLCTEVRVKAEAGAVIVAVFGGKSGDGFSVQADPLTILHLPNILRQLADYIESSAPKG